MIRFRPPLPAVSGLFGKPTILNNVISLASVPIILDKGAAFYKNFGMGRSRGTLPFQISGNIKRGGLVEKAFGLTLRQLLYDFGGGSLSGRPIRAVQVGGPLGAYIPESQFDTPLDYESFAANQGHDRARWRGRLRRHRRYGADGAFCDGILRARVVRKVHALPHRLDAWRGSDGQNHSEPQPGSESLFASGPLRRHAQWVALRTGRVDPVSRSERSPALSAGFRRGRCGSIGSDLRKAYAIHYRH